MDWGSPSSSSSASSSFSSPLPRSRWTTPSTTPSSSPRIGQAIKSTVTNRTRRTVKRVLIILSLILLTHSIISTTFTSSSRKTVRKETTRLKLANGHPIAARIKRATANWNAKVARQSKTWDGFRKEYERRYHPLQPPKGMREWFDTVKGQGHLLVDEYDGLMDQIEPFRWLGGQEVRRRTVEIAKLPTFSLLNISAHHSFFYGQDYRGTGRAVSRDEYGPGIERVEGFASMLQPNIDRIPDGTVFAVSELAEPRVIIPWQDHPSTLLSLAYPLANFTASTRADPSFTLQQVAPGPENLSTLFPTVNYFPPSHSPSSHHHHPTSPSSSLWDQYARSCPPDSSARRSLSRLMGPDSALVAPIGRTATRVELAREKWERERTAEGRKRGKTKTKGIGRFVKRGLPSFEDIPSVSMPKRRTVNATTNQTPHRRQRDQGRDTRAGRAEGGKKVKDAIDLARSPAFRFVGNGHRGVKKADVCGDEKLHHLQGAFFSDWRAVPALYPVFSPSKIDGFSDILIPSNFYYGDDARYALMDNSTAVPWHAKAGKLFWRGKTTGGGNTPPRNQLQYQRHRFVRLASSPSSSPESVLAPSGKASLVRVDRPVSELNEGWMDVGFTGYAGCGDPDICEKTKRLFPPKPAVALSQMSRFKAILDLDGMAFSGRFLALMGMGSAVFKSSIYSDFAADWVEPYYHYVPISSGYDELYNLLAYFLPLPARRPPSTSGLDPSSPPLSLARSTSHASSDDAEPSLLRRLVPSFLLGPSRTEGDRALELLAQRSGEWTESVMGKVDIEAYVYRLALEWARILESEPMTPSPRHE